MKKMGDILIKKTLSSSVIYVNEEGILYERTVNDLIAYLKENSLSLIHFTTQEDDQSLLEGYLVFRNESTFRKHLEKARKAQVHF